MLPGVVDLWTKTSEDRFSLPGLLDCLLNNAAANWGHTSWTGTDDVLAVSVNLLLDERAPLTSLPFSRVGVVTDLKTLPETEKVTADCVTAERLRDEAKPELI